MKVQTCPIPDGHEAPQAQPNRKRMLRDIQHPCPTGIPVRLCLRAIPGLT